MQRHSAAESNLRNHYVFARGGKTVVVAADETTELRLAPGFGDKIVLVLVLRRRTNPESRTRTRDEDEDEGLRQPQDA